MSKKGKPSVNKQAKSQPCRRKDVRPAPIPFFGVPTEITIEEQDVYTFYDKKGREIAGTS
jgi:hypothetical protein